MSAGAELCWERFWEPWAPPQGRRALLTHGMWRGGHGAAPCLLSVLFLPGTSVLPTASTEALPTEQLSNASLASRPGSLSAEPCVSVPLAVLLLFLAS